MGSSSHNGGLRLLVLSLVLLALSAPAWADFWYRPPKFESTSSNGMFVALIERGTTLEMFKVKDGKRSSQWKVQLPYEPHNVLITDDGQYVVLLDHFGRIGFDEAVAIYSRAGLIKSYSLESFAEKEVKARNEELDSMFGRSTSSR